MSIGVCYFPEHWPSERWETDVKQMADAGIEYVRMSEFSWGHTEPERGEFDFEWLDEAVELVGDYGMQAVLCTPTATPPKWLVDEHPDIRQEEMDGTPRHWGSRRFYCLNSPIYRKETERIVRKYTERYEDNPHVVGWQTDNEYGCHETVRCYCDDCAAAFRDWLRGKYDSIEDLNEKWGNTFWSQQYHSFEAVDPPRPTPAGIHPSRLLDYYRFANWSAVDYNRFQADLIREVNDDWFVTHNFMGDFPTLDAYSLSDDIDFLTWDSYPTGFVQDRRPGTATEDELRAGEPDEVGLNHDIYRSAKHKPFWVMEQQPGDVNWPPNAPQPGDGAMRLWAHQAVAHGADVVVYFRWRRCRQGQEQYHAGLRKQDGSPDRGYHEAKQAADELFDIDFVDAPVAVLHDYHNLWATTIQPHSPDWHYWSHLRAFYDAVRGRGIQADVAHPSTDLHDYDAVFAPAYHIVDEDDAAMLREYVEDGGQLVFGARTGVKDPHNQLHETLTPGPLSDLTGLHVEQWETLPDHVPTDVHYEKTTHEFQTWAEWLEPEDAQSLGRYASGEAEGRVAVARNEVGDGAVTYCGCWPDRDLADDIATDVLDSAGIDYTHQMDPGVRVAERDGYTWVLNFTGEPRDIEAPDGVDYVVGSPRLDAYDVAIVETPAPTLTVA